jgi:hypothetical protein
MTTPSFTCPRCDAVSHNPNDARERYCGRCHVFVDDAEEREALLCAVKGVRPEDLRTWPDSYFGAPTWSRWHATIGDFDLDCVIGSGATPEAAIEDLLDQL